MKRRIDTSQQTGERVWAIVYVAVLLDRENNCTRDPEKTFWEEAEEAADVARALWFKRINVEKARKE
jgi:hypothetical protein